MNTSNKVININLYKVYIELKKFIAENKVAISENSIIYNVKEVCDPAINILDSDKTEDCSKKYYIEDIKSCVDKKLIKVRYYTFSETLLNLIDKKRKSDVSIYKHANIDRKHFSKIRKNKLYNPSRNTAICLCMALELNIDETTELLESAGYTLAHNTDFDLIIEYCIIKKIYEIDKINEILYLFDQKTI